MTSRHTISDADELYAGRAKAKHGTVGSASAGNADRRRGLPLTHLYLREYGAIKAQDDDGIVCSYAPSAVISNALPYATGVYLLGITTAGVTQLVLDVPRNITITCTSVGAGEVINIEGKDEYGQKMVERITGTALDASYSSGMKAFKVLDKIYTTWAVTSNLSVGVGNRIGLPYHLSSKEKFIQLSVNGSFASSATDVALVTGLALATDSTSSENDPDVRGTINLQGGIVGDASKVFSALMAVDHTTEDKAYGVPQCTAIS